MALYGQTPIHSPIHTVIHTVSCLMPLLLLLLVCLLPTTALAAEPQPFELHYAASYDDFAATAARSLQVEANGQWLMHSQVHLQLFGSVVSSIDESSRFHWQLDLPLARDYMFQQKGIGSRKRSLSFAADGSSVSFTVNDNSGTLALTNPTYDVLNSELVLRARVAAGDNDITFNVADRGEVKQHHYKVVGTETLVLPAGRFASVHVERLRDAGNDRTTDLWLASDHEFVMVKLLQSEPDGDTITLELKQGSVGGVAITPLAPADRTAAAAP